MYDNDDKHSDGINSGTYDGNGVYIIPEYYLEEYRIFAHVSLYHNFQMPFLTTILILGSLLSPLLLLLLIVSIVIVDDIIALSL